MNFKERQKEIAEGLIKANSKVFRGDQAGAKFRGISRNFVLRDGRNNLFHPTKEAVIKYFKENGISWWGGYKPTGHVLSSQIACLNHLFQIRNDKDAVLAVVRNISPDFINVLLIETDKSYTAYIQFESVSDHDHLNEGIPTRGNNCTSIDALIYAVHHDGSKWIIPIEWKYTEHYSNQNKALEGENNSKGITRTERYTDLINDSTQLKNGNHSCFYYEPFYQLMRQTLWAEQLIKNKETETIKADNFLHVHVIPSANERLLEKIYKCSSDNMENTWRNHLKDQSKYLKITPEKLMKGLSDTRYKELMDYLSSRYWNN